jgi:hypothetical protein
MFERHSAALILPTAAEINILREHSLAHKGQGVNSGLLCRVADSINLYLDSDSDKKKISD